MWTKGKSPFSRHLVLCVHGISKAQNEEAEAKAVFGTLLTQILHVHIHHLQSCFIPRFEPAPIWVKTDRSSRQILALNWSSAHFLSKFEPIIRHSFTNVLYVYKYIYFKNHDYWLLKYRQTTDEETLASAVIYSRETATITLCIYALDFLLLCLLDFFLIIGRTCTQMCNRSLNFETVYTFCTFFQQKPTRLETHRFSSNMTEFVPSLCGFVRVFVYSRLFEEKQLFWKYLPTLRTFCMFFN